MFALLSQGKKAVLVRMDAVTCIHQKGKKSVICFAGHAQADGIEVDEDLACITGALGATVMVPRPRT